MCGIAGIINLRGISRQSLKDMSAALKHRGPDGLGYMVYSEPGGQSLWLNEELPNDTASVDIIGFAHRRLSIIDLSTASLQPMADYARNYCLMYNGELYNYLELRAELERLNYSFRTTGDTEVVLYAYKEWGNDCFKKFNGMWAIAIFDRQKKCVVFSRDRFGIKPLYYTFVDNACYFASEIKGLLKILKNRALPNEKIVAKYLLTGMVDDTEETFFENIYSFPAAHWASVSLHSEALCLKPVPYWSFPNQRYSGSEQNAIDEFRDLFIDAVRLHAASDVPVGTCLSGGLDSSSIVCVSENLRHENKIPRYSHQAFGYCPDDIAYSEKKYMDQVVSATSVQMHYVIPTDEEAFSHLPDIILNQDEPFASASILAQWFVFQTAKANEITVMLDGQGADESLGGYHFYFNKVASLLLARREISKYLSLRRQYQEKIGAFPYSNLYVLKSLIPAPLVGLSRQALGFTRSIYSLIPGLKKNQALSSLGINDLLQKALSKSFLARFPADGFLDRQVTDSLNQELQKSVRSTNLPALLRYEDRNSMIHSIEARVPFLDSRIIDFVFKLPDELLINGIITKYILRQSMKGILPEPIRTRTDKMGFRANPTITYDYIRHNYAALVASKTDFELEWLDGNGLEQLFKNTDIKSWNETADFILWRFVNLKLWLRQHWGSV